MNEADRSPRALHCVRLLLLAGLPWAWLAALTHAPALGAGLAALASGLLLLSGPAPAMEMLELGSVGVLALMLKDLWPVPLPAVTEWLHACGLTGRVPPPRFRNPQIWNGLQQAGQLSAACLTIAAVRCAWIRRTVTRQTGLAVIGLLLTAFCVAVALTTDGARPYLAGNAVLAVGSKNAAATLAGMGFVISAGLAAQHARRRAVVAAGFGLGALASLWVLTHVRSWTGISGATAGCAALVWQWPRSRRAGKVRNRWMWVGAAGCGFLALALALAPELAERTAGLLHDYRWDIWRDALSLLRDRPLGGVGLGSFAQVYPLVGRLELPRDSRLTHPDSSWVLLLIEWGLLPLAILAAAWLWRLRRRSGPEARIAPTSDAASGAIVDAGLAAWAVCGLTDISLHRPETALIGAGLLAFRDFPARSATRPAWLAPLALTASLGIAMTGEWARECQVREEVAASGPAALAWDLLNPKLHWQLALRAWNAGTDHPDLPLALAHFRAVVLLDHRSVAVPETIARFLMPTQPNAARTYWQTALVRAQSDPALTSALLRNAIRDYPNQPPGYWAAICAPIKI